MNLIQKGGRFLGDFGLLLKSRGFTKSTLKCNHSCKLIPSGKTSQMLSFEGAAAQRNDHHLFIAFRIILLGNIFLNSYRCFYHSVSLNATNFSENFRYTYPCL